MNPIKEYFFLFYLFGDRLTWEDKLLPTYTKKLPCTLYLLSVFTFFHFIRNWIEENKVNLAIFVEGDPKAPISIATTPRCMWGCYSISWIALLYPGSLLYNAECKARRHQVPFFLVFGITQPENEPGLPGHWQTLYSLGQEENKTTENLAFEACCVFCPALIIRSAIPEIAVTDYYAIIVFKYCFHK